MSRERVREREREEAFSRAGQSLQSPTLRRRGRDDGRRGRAHEALPSRSRSSLPFPLPFPFPKCRGNVYGNGNGKKLSRGRDKVSKAPRFGAEDATMGVENAPMKPFLPVPVLPSRSRSRSRFRNVAGTCTGTGTGRSFLEGGTKSPKPHASAPRTRRWASRT